MVPETHIPHIKNESDRASIILHASLLENIVLERLKDFMPSLNADEKARIFGFEGPCGSFSNRLRMAHALEAIDRATRRKLEIIKEMRNVAAHANAEVTFDTPEIRQATIELFDIKLRGPLAKLRREAIRYLFEKVCVRACRVVADQRMPTLDTSALIEEAIQRAQRPSLPDKRPEALPRNHPKARKGK
jgi:hypothetical protein